MRAVIVRVVVSALAVVLVLGLVAHSGPTEDSKISFGLPFHAYWEDGDRKRPEWADRLALRDLYEPGLKVALLGERGTCSAKTGQRFEFDCLDGPGFEATLLEGAEKCVATLDIAVIGVAPEAVRLMPSSKDTSPVCKHLELKARRLVRMEPEWAEKAYPLTDSPPKVVRAGGVTLLQFSRQTGASEDKPVFYSVAAIINDRIFPLEGDCTSKHRFFSVNYKLHLIYSSHCCNCGWHDLVVYDLSERTPKKVYENEYPDSD